MIPVSRKKGSKENIYNFRLRTCLNKPFIIDDDRQHNKKIDSILKKHEKAKAELKKVPVGASFKCPYCEYTILKTCSTFLAGREKPGAREETPRLLRRNLNTLRKFSDFELSEFEITLIMV